MKLKRWRCFYVFGFDENYISRGLESWIENSATDPSRQDVICELIDVVDNPVEIELPTLPTPKEEPIVNNSGKEEDKSSGANGWQKQVSASAAPGQALTSSSLASGSVGPVTPDIKLRDGTGTEVNVLPGAWSGMVNVEVNTTGNDALKRHSTMEPEGQETLCDWWCLHWKWIVLVLATAFAAKKGGLF